MKRLVLSLFVFCLITPLGAQDPQDKKFIRKVMDYEKSSGEIVIRLKCVRNPPLNRCTDADFKEMAKESCDSNTSKITKIRKRDCINDIKNDVEVCNYADLTCEKVAKSEEVKVEEINEKILIDDSESPQIDEDSL